MKYLQIRINPLPVKAFSLAELLIVLATLSVIVTFAISTILNVSSEATMKSKFKETYSAISKLMYEGYLTGRAQNGDQFLLLARIFMTPLLMQVCGLKVGG